MRKEEWMVMIENMQKLHYFSRNMLLQNQRLTLRTAEMELMLLIYLKLGELTPLDVSQIMGMRKESVSRTLKSLLSKGYIEKVKCKEDERKYYLYLTVRDRKF